MSGVAVPPAWHERLAGYAWTRQTVGQSDAEVWRLDAPGAASLFVKAETHGAFAELPGEIARLAWLASTGMPCARIVDTARDDDRTWLATTALPGRYLESSATDAATAVAIAADALRALH
ncbi:MAG TPA: phosphotransferase, partial [Tahibacter sp.]|nr:phosphotransferase [Tahibacter sp.]